MRKISTILAIAVLLVIGWITSDELPSTRGKRSPAKP